MSTKRSARASEQITSAMNKYINRRRLDTKRARSVSLTDMASMSMLANATSTGNLVSFSSTTIDHTMAESQYTGFKIWISESEDRYKPELAQLLYPLFTHLYISLLVNCSSTSPPPSPAMKFHKRHLATFQGNPEFKQFIQQLAEVSSPDELDQNPTIASFRSAKYAVTLTDKTYKYLMKYLETNESALLIQILNKEVEITIGDPLGAASRQEMRAGAAVVDEQEMVGEQVGEEMERLQETIRAVREGPPSMPSIALYRVMCEEGLVTSAACDERGAVLGLGGGDSVVRLVDIQPPGEDGGVIDVGSSTIRLGCDRGREFGGVNLNVGEGQVRCLRGHSGPVYGVDWLWEGGLLTCGEDRSVRVWDRGTGAGLCVLRGHNYPVWCVRGDGLGLKFVTGSLDRTVRLWMPELGHPVRVYCGHDGSVDCVGWHPNCSYVVSGSSDKTVRMWSYQDGKCVRMLPTGKGGVTAVSCSPDGKLCASAGEDRRVRVWDLASGSVVKELKGHTGEVTNVVWGSDSRLLISGGNDGVLKVWDVGVGGEGECAGSYSCGPGSLLLGLNFTHTNTLVVTATDSGGLQFS